ncbi:MAG: hypothetical protein ACLRZ3_05650 [Flavonifractor plautii]
MRFQNGTWVRRNVLLHCMSAVKRLAEVRGAGDRPTKLVRGY